MGRALTAWIKRLNIQYIAACLVCSSLVKREGERVWFLVPLADFTSGLALSSDVRNNYR